MRLKRTVMRAHCPECKGARIDTIMVPRQIGEKSAEWRHLCIDCEHYCEGTTSGAGLLWINVIITKEG